MHLRTFAVLVLLPAFAACDGCGKKAAPSAEDSAAPSASAATGATATADPSAAPGDPAPGTPAAKQATQAKATGDAGAVAPAAPGASTAPATSAAVAENKEPAPGKSAYADEIPKPCTDGFGRLGLLTFTDQGGGKVKVSGKNASASCNRIAPTQYQCDWIIDGTPTGSYVDKFDPAKKSVQGSIAKGKMFSCPPSSQR